MVVRTMSLISGNILDLKPTGNTSPSSCYLGRLIIFQLAILLVLAGAEVAYSQPEQTAAEEDFYKIVTVSGPADVALEVSGMNLQPNGDLVVTTRYGDVWLIEDPYVKGQAHPHFKRIASGLHTPLGIASKDGKFYVGQRSELTELTDTDGDEIIDRFRTVSTISMSGNYCEYVHGPIILPDGSFWLNLNLADNGYLTREPFFGEMGHHAPWKGWAVRITPDGELTPIASGLRSPPGMGIGKDGTLYYSENQGGWVGTGYVTTVEEGDFFGHPSSLKSASLPKSNLDLGPEDIPDHDSLMLHEAVEQIPELKMPSVRLPHGVMGTSLSWILEDTTGGAFGPFEGQLFVADQGQSKIMRVFMEEVKGSMQGAAFQFREDFQSGIIRSVWGADGSMFVGLSDRGWDALGTEPDGLQRLVWTGQVPFEVKAIRSKPDGFELEFTKPVDPSTAASTESYQISSFDYLYRKEYGSPLVDQRDSSIKGIILSENRLSARLVLQEPLRQGYIYRIHTGGIQSVEGSSILHPEAFYSLNQVPEGAKANLLGGEVDSHEMAEPAADTSAAATSDMSTSEPDLQNKHVTTLPEQWEDGPDQVINIGTKPGLQYDMEQFQVKAGSRVKIVFTNTDDLQHNLLITAGQLATEVGKQATQMGIEGPQQDYVPDTERVLYHTSLLQPGSSEAIYFRAPSEPGEYEYVCTYPGHYVTMRGVMKVNE